MSRESPEEAADQLLHRFERESRAALNRGFDLRAGLADVRRRAAADRAARTPALSVAGKVVLVDEAERLASLSSDWDEAAAYRLAEIERQWPELGALPPPEEQALRQRLQRAREAFQRRRSPRTVVGSRPQPSTQPPPDDGGTPPLSPIEAECRLRDGLMSADFRSPAWRSVAEAATAYCISVVVAWLRTGHVPRECRLGRSAASELARPWPVEAAEELATEVAMNAVAFFRDNRVARRRWKPETGRTLTDELLDGCAAALPASLRAHRNERLRHDAGPGSTGQPGDDHDRDRIAWRLREEGYSRAEVAELLGFSGVGAVSRAVARFRTVADPPKAAIQEEGTDG